MKGWSERGFGIFAERKYGGYYEFGRIRNFEYDPNRHKVVLKCSLCNGEQVVCLFQELYCNGNSEEFLNRG